MIADDLTGANDTGLQFFRCGLQTTVMLDWGPRSPGAEPSQSTVLVLNTDSRGLTPNEAYGKVQRAFSQLNSSSHDVIYKKIDSTLRGNIGSEIDALLDAYPFDLAVVAPAYPTYGRYTVDGYQMVSQSLLENSEAARDPRQPVRESFVPSILGRQTERKVGHVGIASVREASLAERIEALMDSDQRILVFDSATMEDLQTIVGGVASLQKRVLWVGSAGLAQALAKELLPHLRPAATSGQRSFSSPDPVLIVAGSRNQITLEQVDQVVREGQAQLLSVPVDVLKGNGALERYIAEAVCVLKGKRNLAISVRQPSQEAMTREGDLSLKIAASLGQIASNVIRDSSLAGIILAGIILTGGDIAVQTCQRLGITSLQIRGQVAEGIPISLATERSLANVPIVTKAGGFGDRDVFLQAISMLNHKEEQPHG